MFSCEFCEIFKNTFLESTYDGYSWIEIIFHKKLHTFRSSRPEVFCKEVFLEISQNSQENIYARVSFLINFIIIFLLSLSPLFYQILQNGIQGPQKHRRWNDWKQYLMAFSC